jgi:hypothetical protein
MLVLYYETRDEDIARDTLAAALEMRAMLKDASTRRSIWTTVGYRQKRCSSNSPAAFSSPGVCHKQLPIASLQIKEKLQCEDQKQNSTSLHPATFNHKLHNTSIMPEIFVLRHTEYSCKFRSTRNCHQGTITKHHHPKPYQPHLYAFPMV